MGFGTNSEPPHAGRSLPLISVLLVLLARAVGSSSLRWRGARAAGSDCDRRAHSACVTACVAEQQSAAAARRRLCLYTVTSPMPARPTGKQLACAHP